MINSIQYWIYSLKNSWYNYTVRDICIFDKTTIVWDHKILPCASASYYMDGYYIYKATMMTIT